ncbi:chitinase-3-like protein 1 [Plakobranchus ocellatus]|uniref:Chitinase-3-like protein 1 n=1 Tax=Plakobranchus ocellatus TaxID=259542 RepID=A0AAV4ALY8_9GAST|nr:chitinase-3-like protein 1 [Plakobranchus ocellatus]
MGRTSIRDKCPSLRFLFLASGLGWIYVATVFVIVGLCTNHWIEIRRRNLYNEDVLVHFGLHRVCWKTSSQCNNPGSSYDRQNSVPAVIGLVVAGGFFGIAASIVTLVNLFFDRLGRTKLILSGAGAGLAVLSCILLMVGVIYFSTEVDPHVEYVPVGHKKYEGYSFGLVAAAVGMMFIGGVLNGCSGFQVADPVFN